MVQPVANQSLQDQFVKIRLHKPVKTIELFVEEVIQNKVLNKKKKKDIPKLL